MAGIRFLELLQEDEMAFDNLYCVAFQMMDAQWLAKRASYMEFNVNGLIMLLRFLDADVFFSFFFSLLQPSFFFRFFNFRRL